jgi:threonyl-tRNA synthetase
MNIPSQITEQRHLAAQLLALVVSRLFPNVILVEGGIDSLGFTYDFIFEKPLTENMLELIEIEMHRLIREGLPVRSITMMRENAQALLEHQGHFLLAEMLGKQKSNILELVQLDQFYDLCPALSLTSTHEIGSIKLLEIQELSREIQEEEVRVTRLLGTCQKNGQDLKKFLRKYESFLKKRDHRTLGPRLNLFHFSESVGSLGVTWHPKGVQLQSLLLNFLNQQLLEEEVHQILTPMVARQDFLGFDPQGLEPFFFEGQEYCLRSSPLRQHLAFLDYSSLERGEFPWRIRELSTLFHYYPEREWWGLFCRCAYQGDYTTLVCLKEQVISELISSLHFIEQSITIFGFEAQWTFIASRQKSLKNRQEQEAIGWLKQAIQAHPRSYPYSSLIQEEEGRDPCLELRIRDGLGREWPISRLSVIQSIQENPSLLAQQDAQRVIVTRQIWESLDRLIALLIEHYEGVFPFWLAPEQVRVIAIGESNRDYARQVSQQLQQKGLRVKCDIRQAKLSQKVHEAEKENIPYLVLLGEQERMKQKVSVRTAEKWNHNQSMDIEIFLNKVDQELLISNKRVSGERKSLES